MKKTTDRYDFFASHRRRGNIEAALHGVLKHEAVLVVLHQDEANRLRSAYDYHRAISVSQLRRLDGSTASVVVDASAASRMLGDALTEHELAMEELEASLDAERKHLRDEKRELQLQVDHWRKRFEKAQANEDRLRDEVAYLMDGGVDSVAARKDGG